MIKQILYSGALIVSMLAPSFPRKPHTNLENICRLDKEVRMKIFEEFNFIPKQDNQKKPYHTNKNNKAMPLPEGTYNIASGYGRRTNPMGGTEKKSKDKEFHTGVDLAVSSKTPVTAVADGFISDYGCENGAGRYIKIDHGDFISLYAHLSKIVPAKRFYNGFVRKGEIIGYSGNSGRSTGPHLHYAEQKQGQWVKPELPLTNYIR
jgi:murein DD-endopeptidase MepM/ murein hydrolase activator NlpD